MQTQAPKVVVRNRAIFVRFCGSYDPPYESRFRPQFVVKTFDEFSEMSERLGQLCHHFGCNLVTAPKKTKQSLGPRPPTVEVDAKKVDRCACKKCTQVKTDICS